MSAASSSTNGRPVVAPATPIVRGAAAKSNSPVVLHHLRDSEGYIAVPQSLMSSAVVDDRYKPSLNGFQPPKEGEFSSKFFQGLTIERSLTDEENALLVVR